MSRTKHGSKFWKSKRMSFKQIKRASNSKIRVRSAALCHKAANGVDVVESMFPVKQKCFDPWWIW